MAEMMIFVRKWVPEIFQTSFAPGFDIFIHLEAILRNSKKIDFLNFSFVGSPKMQNLEKMMIFDDF